MEKMLIAHRLRQARERRGITQQAAAEALNLPRASMTQMEAGHRAVSTLELTKLAKLYRYSITYFVDQILHEDEDLEVRLYRAAPGLNQNPVIQQQINRCVTLCREGIQLEQMLGQNIYVSLPAYALTPPRHKGEAIGQGEWIAEQERNRLSIGILPIGELTELIAKQGIWVSSTALPEDISGFLLHDDKIGCMILVNASHVKARKRFSYAHEYAHALMDRDESVHITSTRNSQELREVRANAFAAAFLMPAEGVAECLRSLNKGASNKERVVFDVVSEGKIQGALRSAAYKQAITFKDVAIIAHHFGVSYQTTVYRLRNLNYVSAKMSEPLLAQESMGKRYLQMLHMLSDLDEPEEKKLCARELKNQLAHLAIEAYRRNEISRGRIFELGELMEMGGKNLFDLAEATK